MLDENNQEQVIFKNRRQLTCQYHLLKLRTFSDKPISVASFAKTKSHSSCNHSSNLDSHSHLRHKIIDKHTLLYDNSILNVTFLTKFLSNCRHLISKNLQMSSFTHSRKKFDKISVSFIRSASIVFTCILFLFLYLPVARSASVQKKTFTSSLSLSIKNSSSSIPPSNFDVANVSALIPTGVGGSSLRRRPPNVRSDSYRLKQKKTNNRRRRKGKRRKQKHRKNGSFRRRKTSKKRRRKPGKSMLRRKHSKKDTPKNNPNGHVIHPPKLKRLYNKAGSSFHLVVLSNGRVGGEPSNKESNYSILDIKGVGKHGIVTILGTASRKFICVTKKGRVRALKKYKRSRCRFREKVLQNKQNTYESLSCKECFLNLNRRGRVKRLNEANPLMPPAHFLPRAISQSHISKS